MTCLNMQWIDHLSVQECFEYYDNAIVSYTAAHVGNLRPSHLAFFNAFPDVRPIMVATNSGHTDNEFQPHIMRKKSGDVDVAPHEKLIAQHAGALKMHTSPLEELHTVAGVDTSIDWLWQNRMFFMTCIEECGLWQSCRRYVTLDGMVEARMPVDENDVYEQGIFGITSCSAGFLLPVEVELLLELLLAHELQRPVLSFARMHYLKKGRVSKALYNLAQHVGAVYNIAQFDYPIVDTHVTHVFAAPQKNYDAVEELVDAYCDLQKKNAFTSGVFPRDYTNLKPRFLAQSQFDGIRGALSQYDVIAAADPKSPLFASQHDTADVVIAHPWQYAAPIGDVHFAHSVISQIARSLHFA